MDGMEAEAAPDVVETTDQSLEADTTPESAEVEDRFTDLDPAEAPEELTPEWLSERYKQMQGDYTRKTQAAAETARARQDDIDFLDALRSDPDTQRAVLEQLSEMLGGETDDETYVDDSDATDPMEERLAQLEQERATERAQALATEISSHIDQLAKDSGYELDDEDKRLLFERSTGDKIDRAHTEKVVKDFVTRQTAKRDSWIKGYVDSKQSSQQVPAGTTATDTPDLSSHEARIQRMAAIMRAG